MNGIILINKPIGRTSHDMIYEMRRLTGIKKIGHTGTLDPMATGVLPVCIGNATKIADMITLSDKVYTAQFILGMITDTQDAEGEVLAQCDVNCTREDIINAINSFVGDIEQIPPMYSAIKQNGQKLYELARKGKTVERQKRKIKIHSIDILNIDMNNFCITISVHCSKGTYIRTLCEDIGMKLGVGAYMNTLERTATGDFTISQSYTLKQLYEMKHNDTLKQALIPVDVLFKHYDKIQLIKKQADNAKNGVMVSAQGIIDGKIYRVYDETGRFMCISECVNGRLKLKKSFW